jgi:hypothetical protein
MGFGAHGVRHFIGTPSRQPKFPRCAKLQAGASGQAEAVKAARNIGLDGFAEIERSIDERVGLNRRPNRVGQIGAGFYYYCKIICTRNIEPKLIVHEPETSVASFDLRVPLDGR